MSGTNLMVEKPVMLFDGGGNGYSIIGGASCQKIYCTNVSSDLRSLNISFHISLKHSSHNF